MKLRNLPDRAAIVKRRGKSAVRVETLEITGTLRQPKAVERFRALVSERSAYLAPIDVATLEIETRQSRLALPKPDPHHEGDEQFWQEEE